ncbi:AAA family ATPase [Brachybacterium sp. ACRRE]|uniref:AAA family ATPase n=1 Tax=Brachybacterium sp. ACRRE TaxID=2918184 RepID=UPI001EF22A72|nr:AAA family ATPase [Brachybacterium sp. ACRRE]MCG7309733.1 AAA family ATPase [Brachybacterium sp. ACRRE]
MSTSSPHRGALVLICAPPGTGKSTVLPHLIERGRGIAVVADIDEVLEGGSLLGVKIAHPSAAPIWPAYDRLWDRIGTFVTRAGFDMVLLTQVPSVLPSPEVGAVVGWEVEDDTRAARLRGRQESEATVEDARLDAIALRALLKQSSIVRTGATEAPEQCADALWAAVEPLLNGA